MKVALAYDWANQIGGAERIVAAIGKIFPQADLFTSIHHPKNAPWTKQFSQVTTSFIQKLPGGVSDHRRYFFLQPLAFESFSFDGYDLVISVSSFAGKGIVTKPNTCHINYCLTPPRFLWEKRFRHSTISRSPFLLSLAKKVDFQLAQRPDSIFTISKNVAQKIKRFYRRQAQVIYPGVDTDKFRPAQKIRRGNFFLIVSRLVEYKRVDLAIKATNRLNLPLIIIGQGRELRRLKRLAGPLVKLLGRQPDKKLINYYQRCQAVICPQEEDFGLVALEAQACSTPVISLDRGGARETIINGKTGKLFYPQTTKALMKVLKQFSPAKYRPENCRQNALSFSQKKFLVEFGGKVLSAYDQYRKENN